MTTYEIYIRCRIVWLSLAVAVLSVLLMACLTNAAEIRGEEEEVFTIDQLPSDGHLSSHHEFGALPTDVDCKCRQHTQPQTATKSTSGGARIFYLVMLHNVHTLRDAVHLFRALRDPLHTIVFHVDQKVQQAVDLKYENATLLQSALQSLKDEILSCPCGSRVELQSVHSVEWSKWSMNLPTLWGLQLASSDKYWNSWDVFINLSGDTLPVYAPTRMASILQQLPYNFVTSRSCETGLVPTNVYEFPSKWHKRRHYTNADKDPPPTIHYTNAKGQPQSTTIEYHFGSQWVILQKDFVQYLAKELTRHDSFVCRYRDHLQKKGKVMTDETFLPTILMHVAPFNETLPILHTEGELKGSAVYKTTTTDNKLLPPIYSIRYERMDEKIPSPLRGYYPQHPRYEVPTQPLDGVLLPPNPHTWGPYYLGVYDLADIHASGALFLRKTSSVVDPNLYWILPVDSPDEIPRIQWPPAGVQASAVPDWPQDKLQLMQNAIKEAQKEGQEVPVSFQKEMARLERSKNQPLEEEDPVNKAVHRELEANQESEDL